MEQMNGNELRNALIEKNLINEAGTINTFKVNCISGAHTWPLLSEVLNLYQNDITQMEELQAFLNAVYELRFQKKVQVIDHKLHTCSGIPMPPCSMKQG